MSKEEKQFLARTTRYLHGMKDQVEVKGMDSMAVMNS